MCLIPYDFHQSSNDHCHMKIRRLCDGMLVSFRLFKLGVTALVSGTLVVVNRDQKAVSDKHSEFSLFLQSLAEPILQTNRDHLVSLATNYQATASQLDGKHPERPCQPTSLRDL